MQAPMCVAMLSFNSDHKEFDTDVVLTWSLEIWEKMTFSFHTEIYNSEKKKLG